MSSTSEFTIICGSSKITCEKQLLTNIKYFQMLFSSGMSEVDAGLLRVEYFDLEAIELIVNDLKKQIDLTLVGIETLCNAVIIAQQWLYDPFLIRANKALADMSDGMFPIAIKFFNHLPEQTQSVLLAYTQRDYFYLNVAPNLDEDDIRILVTVKPTLNTLLSLLYWNGISSFRLPIVESLLHHFNIKEIFETHSYLIKELIHIATKIPSLKIQGLLLSHIQPLLLVKGEYDAVTRTIIQINDLDLSKLGGAGWVNKSVPNKNPPITYKRMNITYEDRLDWVIQLPQQRLTMKLTVHSSLSIFGYGYQVDDDDLVSKFNGMNTTLAQYFKDQNDPRSEPNVSQMLWKDNRIPGKPTLFLTVRSTDFNINDIFIDARTKEPTAPKDLLNRPYNITIFISINLYKGSTETIIKRLYKVYVHDYIPNTNKKDKEASNNNNNVANEQDPEDESSGSDSDE
jgi:hypothetical protein